MQSSSKSNTGTYTPKFPGLLYLGLSLFTTSPSKQTQHPSDELLTDGDFWETSLVLKKRALCEIKTIFLLILGREGGCVRGQRQQSQGHWAANKTPVYIYSSLEINKAVPHWTSFTSLLTHSSGISSSQAFFLIPNSRDSPAFHSQLCLSRP